MTAKETNCIETLVERIDNLIGRLEEHLKADEKFREESAKDRKELHQELLEIRTQFNLCQAEKAQRLRAATPWADKWRGLAFNLMQIAVLLGAAAIFSHMYTRR